MTTLREALERDEFSAPSVWFEELDRCSTDEILAEWEDSLRQETRLVEQVFHGRLRVDDPDLVRQVEYLETWSATLSFAFLVRAPECYEDHHPMRRWVDLLDEADSSIGCAFLDVLGTDEDCGPYLIDAQSGILVGCPGDCPRELRPRLRDGDFVRIAGRRYRVLRRLA